MLNDRMDIQRQNGSDTSRNGEQFISDTQKIVRRHLENQHDVITEDDIRNVRVGMTPPMDEATLEAIREREEDEKIADKKTTDEDETIPGNEKITPWDIIAPEEE